MTDSTDNPLKVRLAQLSYILTHSELEKFLYWTPGMRSLFARDSNPAEINFVRDKNNTFEHYWQRLYNGDRNILIPKIRGWSNDTLDAAQSNALAKSITQWIPLRAESLRTPELDMVVRAAYNEHLIQKEASAIAHARPLVEAFAQVGIQASIDPYFDRIRVDTTQEGFDENLAKLRTLRADEIAQTETQRIAYYGQRAALKRALQIAGFDDIIDWKHYDTHAHDFRNFGKIQHIWLDTIQPDYKNDTGLTPQEIKEAQSLARNRMAMQNEPAHRAKWQTLQKRMLDHHGTLRTQFNARIEQLLSALNEAGIEVEKPDNMLIDTYQQGFAQSIQKLAELHPAPVTSLSEKRRKNWQASIKTIPQNDGPVKS